jgi:hypothetical protein
LELETGSRDTGSGHNLTCVVQLVVVAPSVHVSMGDDASVYTHDLEAVLGAVAHTITNDVMPPFLRVRALPLLSLSFSVSLSFSLSHATVPARACSPPPLSAAMMLPSSAHADMTTLPKDINCTAPSLIPTVNGNTIPVRSFSTHGQQSAEKRVRRDAGRRCLRGSCPAA